MLALMALWETLAPRRTLRVGRRRWSANLTLTFLNTLVLRFAVPLGTYGAAEFTVDRERRPAARFGDRRRVAIFHTRCLITACREHQSRYSEYG